MVEFDRRKIQRGLSSREVRAALLHNCSASLWRDVARDVVGWLVRSN